MVDTSYNDLVDRIRGIYSSSTDVEKSYLKKILYELSEFGTSET